MEPIYKSHNKARQLYFSPLQIQTLVCKDLDEISGKLEIKIAHLEYV